MKRRKEEKEKEKVRKKKKKKKEKKEKRKPYTIGRVLKGAQVWWNIHMSYVIKSTTFIIPFYFLKCLRMIISAVFL